VEGPEVADVKTLSPVWLWNAISSLWKENTDMKK